MAVTIKQIAQACNISRGTVDRVLNNRGKVKPETEQLIRETANRLGYVPNPAGRALAAQKKNYVIGILLISEGIRFYDEVIAGIRRAEQEIHSYGVGILLKTMRGYQIEKQLALIDEMKSQIHFLILNPMNDQRIADKIAELTEEGIEVLTINTDIEDSKRISHVGCDYVKSGETAAGLLGLVTRGKAKVGIATGTPMLSGHNQRITGFHTICKEKYPMIEILDIIETNDDDTCAYENTRKMLEKHKDISAIYIVAAGTVGVCKAVEQAGLVDQITIVSSDLIPETRDLIQRGIIKATICQQPFTQGYKAVNMAFKRLVSNITPTKELNITKNEIKILENMN
ncbi:LacI family DNA-binding transcriptional regulator [Anaerosporobacter faecicola]|uniref:LacI family DNA-binding transcriptional regulator n=1 Tax=Anaerosporobacter faecicola TaxID=2718714 RepID=UPI00143C9819|nr:LacI family DNA-binding transcriptional regulator [Anaerosporobacter faecicola]